MDEETESRSTDYELDITLDQDKHSEVRDSEPEPLTELSDLDQFVAIEEVAAGRRASMKRPQYKESSSEEDKYSKPKSRRQSKKNQQSMSRADAADMVEDTLKRKSRKIKKVRVEEEVQEIQLDSLKVARSFETLLVEWVAMDGISLVSLDSARFAALLEGYYSERSRLDRQLQWSNEAIIKNLEANVGVVEDNLRDYFGSYPGNIVLLIDRWVDSAGCNQYGITGTWITEDWTRKSCLLEYNISTGSGKELIKFVLDKYGLQGKVLGVVYRSNKVECSDLLVLPSFKELIDRVGNVFAKSLIDEESLACDTVAAGDDWRSAYSKVKLLSIDPLVGADPEALSIIISVFKVRLSLTKMFADVSDRLWSAGKTTIYMEKLRVLLHKQVKKSIVKSCSIALDILQKEIDIQSCQPLFIATGTPIFSFSTRS